MQAPFQQTHDAVPLRMAPAHLPAGPEEQEGLRIKLILKDCVTALTMGNVAMANTMLTTLSHIASLDGRPMQRVASAFLEALKQRVHGHLQPPRIDFDYARYKFAMLCPLFGVVVAAAVNHTVVQAMEGERDIHVVDLGGGATPPKQWMELLCLLVARPGGAPHRLCLTIVCDQEGFLSFADRLLRQEATRLQIPFVFNPVRLHQECLGAANVASSLGVERGQALAVTSTLQMHRLIGDVVSIEQQPAGPHDKKGKKKEVPPLQVTKADALLRVLCDLPLKVMLLTEQEADHNSANLWDRVRNSFDYYAALFCDIGAGDASMASDRAMVERLLLQEEITDIVARDDMFRRERHESMLCWEPRMLGAGYEPARVSFDVYRATANLAYKLSSHSGDGGQRLYRVVKNNGCFFFYSRKTLMFALSVWQPSKSLGN